MATAHGSIKQLNFAKSLDTLLKHEAHIHVIIQQSNPRDSIPKLTYLSMQDWYTMDIVKEICMTSLTINSKHGSHRKMCKRAVVCNLVEHHSTTQE